MIDWIRAFIKIQRRIELLYQFGLQILRCLIRQDVEDQVFLHPFTQFSFVIGIETHLPVVGIVFVPGNQRVAEEASQRQTECGLAGVATEMTLPDALIEVLLRDAGIDDFLTSELLGDNLMAKRRQCCDVPDGHDVISRGLRNLAAAVGQWIEWYEVFEVHNTKVILFRQLFRVYLQHFALAAGILDFFQEGSFEIVLGFAAAVAQVALDEVGVQKRVVAVSFVGIVDGSVGGFELLFGLVGHRGLMWVLKSFP